jgi:dGTPase
MTYDWNKLLSGERRRRSGAKRIKEIEYRIELERDYDRLLFSTPVRRLADKTQVFPLDPHDSVRTRLTHSHEVANLARGIGTSLSYRHAKELGLEAVDQYTRAVPSLLAAIGLSHDLGNPPFGHQGEEAIQSWIKKNSQAPTAQVETFNIFDGHLTEKAQQKDFLKFEGNAQALRLLTRLQIVSDDYGLNMSYAFLAALLKYPVPSDKADKSSQSRKKFNFFQSEADVVADVWEHTGLSEGKRHPLTFIMEACDDIAYCVLDLEDAAKKGLISFNDVVAWLNHVGGRDSEHPDEMVTLVCDQAAAHEKKHRTFDLSGAELGDISMQMLRVDTIGLMVNAVTKAFVAYANQILAGSFDDELLKVSAANRLDRLCRSGLAWPKARSPAQRASPTSNGCGTPRWARRISSERPNRPDRQKTGAISLSGSRRTGSAHPCAYRKSNPDIFVMQSAEDWTAKNTPYPLYGAR